MMKNKFLIILSFLTIGLFFHCGLPIVKSPKTPEIPETPETPPTARDFPPPADLPIFKNGHPNLEPPKEQSKVQIINRGSTEAYIGQIKMFAGNFAPRGWNFCNGQTLNIADHSALFSILGTTYGGDGRTTFSLPDLRGRAPVHAGQNTGQLTNHKLGQMHGNAKASSFQEEYKNIDHLKTLIEVTDSPAPQEGVMGQSTLAVYYIIATSGIFPSRN